MRARASMLYRIVRAAKRVANLAAVCVLLVLWVALACAVLAIPAGVLWGAVRIVRLAWTGT